MGFWDFAFGQIHIRLSAVTELSLFCMSHYSLHDDLSVSKTITSVVIESAWVPLVQLLAWLVPSFKIFCALEGLLRPNSSNGFVDSCPSSSSRDWTLSCWFTRLRGPCFRIWWIAMKTSDVLKIMLVQSKCPSTGHSIYQNLYSLPIQLPTSLACIVRPNLRMPFLIFGVLRMMVQLLFCFYFDKTWRSHRKAKIKVTGLFWIFCLLNSSWVILFWRIETVLARSFCICIVSLQRTSRLWT